MILTSLQETKPISIETPWGKEQGFSYLGHNFVPSNAYKNVKDAIAACRIDLDTGLFSLVVPEGSIFRVWCLLPV